VTGLSPAGGGRSVLYVTPGFPPRLGGVETHVAQLAVRAASEGWTVEVLSQDGLHRSSVEKYRGVTVRRFPNVVPSRNFPLAPSLFAYLHRHACHYDVVHAHNYHALPALAAALAGHPNLVFTPHYLGIGHSAAINALHRLYSPAGNFIFRRASRVVCVTRTEATEVQRRFHVPVRRVEVIPNGIEVDRIRAAPPFPTTDRVILSAGRLERYKNVDLVIRALPHLEDCFVLYVAGDGRARKALQALARQLGVIDRVRFLGQVDHPTLNRWYRTACVYVSMSGRECFGITLLEAVAAGAAVVAADTPVHREVLGTAGSITSALVPVSTGGTALSQAFRAMATAHDATQSRECATAAGLPSWKDVAGQTLEVYGSLLRRRRIGL
jgi:glycosyltransferase involved in cell wall biosynthesis